jgi:F420-dependent oxidoreductase-like protein
MHPLHVGLKLAGQIFPIPVHRAVWRIADDAGFDGCWGFDHFIALGPDPSAPVFEGWAMLAAMAEATKGTRLGLMVTGNLYRHPGVLAKLGATVDHLSGGRLEMGIGAAWNEPEFAMLGLDLPAVGERIRRLDEACTVVKKLWTEERATFAGRYYQLQDAIAEPKPVQRPFPPIWIGGSGPKKTLRVVARHADVWNSNDSDLGKATELSAILDEHCRAIGRDPGSIRRSVQFRFTDVEETLRAAELYLRAGFSEQIVMLIGPDPVKSAELAARKLLPRKRTLG